MVYIGVTFGMIAGGEIFDRYITMAQIIGLQGTFMTKASSGRQAS